MNSLYLHIPYCQQSCSYCNFHFSTVLKNKSLMLEAMYKEIAFQKENKHTKQLYSIYFGGGTPSLFSVDEIAILLKQIRQYFTCSQNMEITIEVNPEDITEDYLKGIYNIGINRLSVGVQSLLESELTFMNRLSSTKQVFKALDFIAKSSFDNYSFDIIYGIPESEIKTLEFTIHHLLSYNPKHISAYALTLEKKTLLDYWVKKKKVTLMSDTKLSEQFFYINNVLSKQRYEHYEISNYSQKGFRSKHNVNYWSGNAYLGIGPSAHSFDGKRRRYWNLSNNALYVKHILENKLPIIRECEILSNEQRANEIIMLGLRTSEGISLSKLKQECSKDIESRFKDKVLKSKSYAQGNVFIRDNRVVLYSKAKFICEAVTLDLMI